MFELDESKVEKLLNKTVIIGLTYVDHEGNLVEQKQFHGEIIRINLDEGVVVLLADSDAEYTLPPDLNAFREAPPGEYRASSTGEVVVNPEFITTWTIKQPKP